jgi:hypothetical protein
MFVGGRWVLAPDFALQVLRLNISNMAQPVPEERSSSPASAELLLVGAEGLEPPTFAL